MADLTFDEAVKVVELIEEGHKHLTPAIGDKTPATMTEYIVAGYAMGATAADRRALLLYELPLAAMDSAVWDAIDRIAQAHLRSGYPMPRELGEWDAARREGKRPRPSKRGPKPKPVRDKVIASTVQALVDRGFYPTGHPRLRMTSERTRGRASAVRGRVRYGRTCVRHELQGCREGLEQQHNIRSGAPSPSGRPIFRGLRSAGK